MASVASQYVDFGLDRDEGSYINFGEVLRHGGDMYKDAYSFKPPAIFYSYAAFNTIFGFSGSGLRWSLIVANALAAGLLFIFGYRWKGGLFACITALAYTFFTFNPFVFGFAALAEQYQNFIAILAIVLIQQGLISKKWIWLLAGGAVFTYAVLFKQNLIFAYGAISIGLGYYFLFGEAQRNWKALFYFVGGSAISALLIYLPVIIQGTLKDCLYWNFTYSSLYTSSIPWEKGQEFLAAFFKKCSSFNYWMWVVGFIGVLAGTFLSKKWTVRITVPLVFLASLGAIFPGLRFYPHYWSYFSPILSIGCGFAVYYIQQYAKPFLKPSMTGLLLVALFIGGLFYVRQQQLPFFKDVNEIYVNRRMYGDNPFTETRFLGDFLKKRIKSNEELLIFGSEPQMYAYIGRPTPTPYMFFAHLNRPHERKDGMIQNLQKWAMENKPKYVYFSNHPFSWVMIPGSDNSMYNWATNYVANGHRVIGVADILPGGQPPKIILGPQAASYQPTSQKWVKLYERVGG